MKYSDLKLPERKGALTIEQATEIVGGNGLMRLMREAGWLVPVVQQKRLTRFDYDDALEAWQRLCDEGYDSLKADARGQN